jgi:hypothetical protein
MANRVSLPAISGVSQQPQERMAFRILGHQFRGSVARAIVDNQDFGITSTLAKID